MSGAQEHDDHDDEPREIPSEAPELPPSLAARLRDVDWHRNLVGEAGAIVHRLSPSPRSRGDEAPSLYLKHGADDAALAIADEFARLQWLQGRWPVPAIEHFEVSTNAAASTASEDESAPHGKTWLLTHALPGRTAYEWLAGDGDGDGDAARAVEIVAAIGRFLRRLHALPVSTCPFNARHELQLDLARQRLDAGLIDADDFDDERQGWSPEQVWAAMHALLPMDEDLVVSHGDLSLDNILIGDRERGGDCDGDRDEDGKGAVEVIGVIDLGRVGIADRYRDLAILANCLDEFSPDLRATFFTAYGIAEPDARKLDFHLLMDECF